MTLLDRFRGDADGEALARAAARWLHENPAMAGQKFSTERWQAMAGNGWTGLRLPEAFGGLALPLRACLPLIEAAGAAGLREPVVECACVAAPLAAAARAPADLLTGLVSGTRLAVWAEARPQAGAVMACHVPGGTEVTDLLLSLPDPQGVPRLCLVPAAEMHSCGYAAIDGRALSDRRIDDTGHVLLEGAAAGKAIARARAERDACLAAEGLGAMARAIALSASHLSAREQFGKPLKQFQVLAHRLAAMQVDLELSRSAAAMLIPDAAPLPATVSDLFLAQITRAMRVTGERAIQLHGGMGMAAESEIGEVFRRLLYLSTALGGETAPRTRLQRGLAQRIRQTAETGTNA